MVVAVNPSVAAKNLTELTALAKSEPGKLTYASCGVGTPQHFAIEMYREMAGINMLHVPYRGCASCRDGRNRRPSPSYRDHCRANGAADQGRPASPDRLHQQAPHRSTAPGCPYFQKEAGTSRLRSRHLVRNDGSGKDADGDPRQGSRHGRANLGNAGSQRKGSDPSASIFFITTRAEHAKTLHDDIEKYRKLVTDMKIERPNADQ